MSDHEATSLRDELLKNLKESSHDGEESNIEESNEHEEAEDGNAEEISAEEDQGGDQHEAETATEDSEDENGESQEEVEELSAPLHWAQEDREAFSTLDEEGKRFIMKRHREMEGGFTKKTQELAEERKRFEPVQQFVEKWEPHVNNLGVPLVNGLERLLEADNALRNGTPEQKRATALQIMQQYGIDLNTPTPQEEDAYSDPQVKALQDQISQLDGKLQTREQAEQQAIAEKQAQAVKEAQSAIEAFKSLKDDSGNLKYQHFDTLEADITALIQSGQAGNGDFSSQLDTAYNKALWMNNTTREQLLEQQQSSLKAEQITKQKKAAAQAKKSAKANKKGANVNATRPSKTSLRDDLRAQLEQANL